MDQDDQTTPRLSIGGAPSSTSHQSSSGIKVPLLPSAQPRSASDQNLTNRSLLNSSIPPTGLAASKRKLKNKAPKRHKLRFALLTLLVIVLGGLIAGGWDAWQLYHKVNHLKVGNLSASVNGDENILVAGSTNRCNLKVQNSQWGFCSEGVTGVNSDVIFIVHLNQATKDVSILSIPRDTFVPNARSGNEAFKIDAALYQGPTQLVNAVEEDFGIPIQHYVEVGFDGFVNIVNAVGGINMYFPMPVYDSESYLDVTTPGCHLLNGVEALQVVRARHLQYKPSTITTDNVYYWPQETESDIARITRTHEFLRVLASAVVDKGLSNPISDQKLVDAIAPQIQVDSGLSASNMLQFINIFHGVNINNIPQLTLPISLPHFGSYYANNYNYGDVVFPSNPQDLNTIDQFLGISSSIDPLTDKPFPSPSTIKVSVANGSGQSNQATTIASGLSGLGFVISGQPQTVAPISSQAQETVVYYASSITESDALAVAAKLSGPVILSQNASQVFPGSQVTLITGTNAAVIIPSSKSSTSNSSSASTPNTNPMPAASSVLAAPTSADQGLSAWDPRACPKS